MKIYLFTRADKDTRSEFRVYYILENLKAVQNISVIYFVCVALVCILARVLNLNLDELMHIPSFLSSIYTSLFVLPVFYIMSRVMVKNFRPKKQYLAFSQAVVILISLYLISRGLFNTFFAMNNPRNSLTMYMVWLLVISVFFVFEYYETLALSFICMLAFSILLPYYQHTVSEVIKNQFVSLVLTIIFFYTSRHIFSYRVNHFIQLKTIREKNAEIESANKFKDEILGIVAHDLRNPLSAIESIAMLMEMESDEVDESQTENLAMIKTSCLKAKAIINDLLEVAHNDAVKNFGVQEVDLNTFINEVVDQWHYKLHTNQLIFKPSKKAVSAVINKEKMQRVMDNLISNAIKFSVDGKPIRILLKEDKGKCFIEVKDSGLGIAPEMIPYVFDRFSKAGRKGVRGEDSVGMGLSIVRQIVKKHDGDITVQSVVEKGTTFSIMLPQYSASAPAG